MYGKAVYYSNHVKNAANLEGEITQVQDIGTHSVYMVEMKQIIVNDTGHGPLLERKFHPVMHQILEPTA